VQNMTAGPICLEKVQLESSQAFTGVFLLNINQTNISQIFSLCSPLSKSSEWEISFWFRKRGAAPGVSAVPLLSQSETIVDRRD
jgi:hypothetical protein